MRELGEQAGGRYVDETHFVADGNQVMSMWPWLVFMRHNVEKRRWFGVPMPKPNLKVEYEKQRGRIRERVEHRFGDTVRGSVSLAVFSMSARTASICAS